MKLIGFSSGGVGGDTNVDRLVKTILRGSATDTEFVKLTDLRFSGCKGCVQLCAAPQVCTLDDDLAPYYRKIKEADAVVLGSPVYFSRINTTMLAFIERFFGYRHVTVPIRGKPFILVVSSGVRDPAPAVEHFQGVLRPFGVKILDCVTFGSEIPPCLSCGRHHECRIGGLYGVRGEAALTTTVRPDMFHRWEDCAETRQAVDSARERLRGILATGEPA